MIPAISDDAPRPRWSVLIPTHNCANFLKEALESVLVQDQGEAKMEIIVVDDHSTADDPEAVVERIGRGRVRFLRQERNVGKVRNYETGLLASRGFLIHQLHGDDRVRQGFYSAMDRAFDAFSDAGAFFCESIYVNQAGKEIGRTGKERAFTGLLEDWLALIVLNQRIQTPSMVLRRDVYETLGGFDRRLNMVEDWEMWIRVAMAFPVGFCAEALAEYRSSPGGATVKGLLSGEMVGQTRKMLSIVDEYLPPEMVARSRGDRNRGLAQALTQFIPFLMERGEYRAVLRLYADALRFSAHPRAAYRLLYFTARYRQFL